MTSAQKITPCLWFNFNAEAAVEHYLSISRTPAFSRPRVTARPRRVPSAR